jgi:hypothetical protein
LDPRVVQDDTMTIRLRKGKIESLKNGRCSMCVRPDTRIPIGLAFSADSLIRSLKRNRYAAPACMPKSQLYVSRVPAFVVSYPY